ncbi:hypothetical protein L2Y96_12220 [Luteibacter aegosomaticola]|uniref:hypothetical protein n=1 Tax=Luteibacter aegosomaticola TaxID=2911538 RepID=UPI001FF815DF|nr:hypothetical protein [Luteibacter aegosomaticola]UPG88185.1 hypothetical protein L2Y96_12220 [Luteibacter aegosomaticola]
MNRPIRPIACSCAWMLVSLMPGATFATCLDAQPSIAKEAHDSSMVVVGTATEEHLVPDPDDPVGYIFTIYVVQVNEVLKGPAPKSLWLYSENTSARYPMDLGVPNLLFIIKTPTDAFVDNCGNSAPMKEAKAAYDEVKRTLSTRSAKTGH